MPSGETKTLPISEINPNGAVLLNVALVRLRGGTMFFHWLYPSHTFFMAALYPPVNKNVLHLFIFFIFPVIWRDMKINKFQHFFFIWTMLFLMTSRQEVTNVWMGLTLCQIVYGAKLVILWSSIFIILTPYHSRILHSLDLETEICTTRLSTRQVPPQSRVIMAELCH